MISLSINTHDPLIRILISNSRQLSQQALEWTLLCALCSVLCALCSVLCARCAPAETPIRSLWEVGTVCEAAFEHGLTLSQLQGGEAPAVMTAHIPCVQ